MPSLKELVKSYGEMKQIVDGYKKPIEEANSQIKSIMSSKNLSEFESGGFKAKYSVSKSESFDDDKLVKKLKECMFDGKSAHEAGLIDYVPVVNMEVLEDFIYNGKINAASLADCKVTKETARLTISKVKE